MLLSSRRSISQWRFGDQEFRNMLKLFSSSFRIWNNFSKWQFPYYSLHILRLMLNAKDYVQELYTIVKSAI